MYAVGDIIEVQNGDFAQKAEIVGLCELDEFPSLILSIKGSGFCVGYINFVRINHKLKTVVSANYPVKSSITELKEWFNTQERLVIL
jgi:hypothetical protein